MNYQSGDKLKNRYLSNDAFTSLKNKLGGRSITSLGNNRRRNGYKIVNQSMSLFEYRNIFYKTLLIILLTIICIYIIPQTRYFLHGYVAQSLSDQDKDIAFSTSADIDDSYDIAPVFFKTDQFLAKQKENYIPDGLYVYDFISKNVIGTTLENSASNIKIKLFSDSGYKNNFLIEQENIINIATTSSSTETVQEFGNTYESHVFEGLGYGQIVAKVPPKTVVKKDSYVYVRTLDGLKPFAKIINVDEDNKSTFTIIYAQLLISPQNVYKVIFK